MPIPVPTVPGLDLADAMARLDLSFDEFKELLAVFPDAVREEMAKLEASATAGDMAATRFAAHAMAGLAGNYGAKNLWAAAKELELAIHDNQSASVPALLGKIRKLADESSLGVEALLR